MLPNPAHQTDTPGADRKNKSHFTFALHSAQLLIWQMEKSNLAPSGGFSASVNNDLFPETGTDNYWSSTANAAYTSHAMFVNSDSGDVGSASITVGIVRIEEPGGSSTHFANEPIRSNSAIDANSLPLISLSASNRMYLARVSAKGTRFSDLVDPKELSSMGSPQSSLLKLA